MLKTHNLNINDGIFKEDSLSLFHFCIALIPLSVEHKNTADGYKTTTKNKPLILYRGLNLYAKDDLY